MTQYKRNTAFIHIDIFHLMIMIIMNLLGGEQSGKGVDRVGWEQEEGVVNRLQQFAINDST